MKGFIKLGLVFALCAGVVGADEFGEARKRYVTKPPSAKSAMEGSGVFVGIELGLAQHTFQIDLSKLTDKYDIKQAALAVGAKFGYKHFFVKWVGLRGYVDVNYVESRYIIPAAAMSKSKGNINGFTNDISYGVNADILLNFYNGETTFFGAFVGVGVGYQNAADNLWGNMLIPELSGNAVSVEKQKLNTTRKMSGLYADAKVGLRVNVAKHHEMEFIATIPFTTISKEFSDDGGTTTVPANYRQNYKFMLGYNFVF